MKKASKKRSNENDPFLLLPLDLKIQILLKLPAKSIARLRFVSKHWSSITRSKYFTNLYMTQSLTRPRLLFAHNNIDHSLLLHSCSEEDQSPDHQKVNIAASHQDVYMKASNIYGTVRGLICHQSQTKVIIANPSTGQFITLPTMRRLLFSLLGYDPVNDLYKVFSMTLLHGYKVEHYVFTLGSRQKWRKISCKYLHRPEAYTKRICINGVVYYFAWNEGQSIMCFDVTSENFSEILKLPENIHCLVNYRGKIALYSHDKYAGTLNLWVLQDAKKQEWSKVFHLVPSLLDLVGIRSFDFKGTLSTGQLVFAPRVSFVSQPFVVIIYDPEEKTTKKVVIEAIGDRSLFTNSYLDHVESLMDLSNVYHQE